MSVRPATGFADDIGANGRDVTSKAASRKAEQNNDDSQRANQAQASQQQEEKRAEAALENAKASASRPTVVA